MSTGRSTSDRVLVVLPVRDDVETLPVVIDRLHAVVPTAEILVVDDDSLDGTGQLARTLAEDHAWVHVLECDAAARGVSAPVAGLVWALGGGYDVVVELAMTHRADDVPRLLDALADADVAVGSRWIPGGGVRDWPSHRRLLVHGGALVAQAALGSPVHDVAGGLRAYRREALGVLELAGATGEIGRVALLQQTLGAGLRIREIPVVADLPRAGHASEPIARIAWWSLGRRLSSRRPRTSRTDRRGSSGAA